MAVRQFCSYQSKSGHSQWTLKPSKMAVRPKGANHQ
jgi:hypothetical protein